MLPVFLYVYNVNMKRSTSSKTVKSSNKKTKYKFDIRDKTLFEKDTIFEGKPFKIKGIVDFTKPDIILEERK